MSDNLRAQGFMTSFVGPFEGNLLVLECKIEEIFGKDNSILE